MEWQNLTEEDILVYKGSNPGCCFEVGHKYEVQVDDEGLFVYPSCYDSYREKRFIAMLDSQDFTILHKAGPW